MVMVALAVLVVAIAAAVVVKAQRAASVPLPEVVFEDAGDDALVVDAGAVAPAVIKAPGGDDVERETGVSDCAVSSGAGARGLGFGFSRTAVGSSRSAGSSPRIETAAMPAGGVCTRSCPRARCRSCSVVLRGRGASAAKTGFGRGAVSSSRGRVAVAVSSSEGDDALCGRARVVEGRS